MLGSNAGSERSISRPDPLSAGRRWTYRRLGPIPVVEYLVGDSDSLGGCIFALPTVENMHEDQLGAENALAGYQKQLFDLKNSRLQMQ